MNPNVYNIQINTLVMMVFVTMKYKLVFKKVAYLLIIIKAFIYCHKSRLTCSKALLQNIKIALSKFKIKKRGINCPVKLSLCNKSYIKAHYI